MSDYDGSSSDPGPGPGPGSLDTAPPGGISSRMRALLEEIGRRESGGQYDIRYGGAQGPQRFEGFGGHPNVAVPIPGDTRTSTAAGKYQFLNSTWGPIAAKLGLPNFGPENQDQGAAHLATETYHSATGRDLEADLGEPARLPGIYAALKGQWPTLGAQQGLGMPGGSPGLSPFPTFDPSKLVAAGGANPLMPQGFMEMLGNRIRGSDAAGPNSMVALQMLQMLLPKSHKFEPVDYDPWKYVPKLGGKA